uniref:Uncharacterized protein n=1 Tax=Seriola dumerili TaxID=41447 RepID=A0A3B4UQ01_SERDU
RWTTAGAVQIDSGSEKRSSRLRTEPSTTLAVSEISECGSKKKKEVPKGRRGRQGAERKAHRCRSNILLLNSRTKFMK